MEYSRPGIEAFVSKIVGLKGEDLDWASGLGKKYGQNEELDGRGDAARHLALGWLAANAENPETAKRAIQAREYLDTDYIRELLGGQFFGKEMDLQNNNLGMQIPAKTKEEAEAMIGRIIEGGDATFMTPQESRDMRGYAEGGAVEPEYAYGFGPEASGIGQLVSPLMPFRREVVEPYQESFVESADPNKMERVVSPGQYGDVEAAIPEAIKAIPELYERFKNMSAEDVKAGVGSLVDYMKKSSEAGLQGESEVYDPETGQAVSSTDFLLAAPTTLAPATALSIARTAGEGGKVLGIFGGESASNARGIKARVEKLRERGLEGQDLWEAQANQSKRGYIDPSDGQFRIEFDTSNAKIIKSKPNKYDPSRIMYGPENFETSKLPDVLDFPEIFEAYPQFKEITVRTTPLFSFDLSGAYDPKTKTMLLKPTDDPEKVLSTALHELQHAVQTEEGMLSGASPSMFLRPEYDADYKDVTGRKKRYEKEIEQDLKDSYGVDKPTYGASELLAGVASLRPDQRPALYKIKELSEIDPGDYKKRIALKKEITDYLGPDGLESFRLERLIGDFRGDVERVLEASTKLKPVLDLYTESLEEYFQLLTENKNATSQYRRVPGEVEARNVQERRKNPDLRETFPPNTADFPPGEMVYPVDPAYRQRYLKIGQQGPEPRGMAEGGGVAALAPMARNMYNQKGDNIRQGVGAFTQHISRRA